MASGLNDLLRITLSNGLEMADSDIKELSAILAEQELVESAYNSGLVQIMDILIRNNIALPVSLKYLRALWETENISFQFVRMISSLVKDGLLSIRKVKSSSLLLSQDVTLVDGELPESGVYLTVYATDKFKAVFSAFFMVSTKQKAVIEGAAFWKGRNKQLAGAFMRAATLLKNNLHINLSEESIAEDERGHTRVNLSITDTSKYSCKDSDLTRIAKKHLKKCKCVADVEIYKESDSEVFLGVDLSLGNPGISDVAYAIYNLFDELEVDYV